MAAARTGADAIGFVFWRGTPRFVDHERARTIARALPPFVSIVGLFVDPSLDEVRAALDEDLDTPGAIEAIDRAAAKGLGVSEAAALLGVVTDRPVI